MGIPLYGQNKDGNAIDEAAKDKKQVYNFGTPPVVSDYEHAVAQLVDGTAGDTTLHQYADGLAFTLYPIVAQDNDSPAAAATGMDYSYEQDDDDGIEWRMSDNTCKGREGIDRFTVGRQAFSAELEFSIADVSGTDDCAFGFAKVEAHAAAIDGRDESAVLNVISGNITIETILNNAATTVTDTTDDWADTEIHSLKVLVAKDGAVTYKIDGADPTTTAAFSFDIGEVVTPSFYLLQAADLSGAIVLRKFIVESDNGSME
tara:strand:- start:43 stop:822 length:780 start_codon:yes stop_codon:yes gene_type:complete